MAIKVGGTTVIDDSRNLCSTGYANVTTVNATTICATTLYGSGTNLTGISSPPAAQCFTACTAICLGYPVVVTDTTGISAMLGDPLAIGTGVTSRTNSYYANCCGGNFQACGLNNLNGTDRGVGVGGVGQQWSVNFCTGANTIHSVAYSGGAIGFNSALNARCAGCCNTSPYCCNCSTLSSGFWYFNSFCLDTSTCNLCSAAAGCVAWCPCVGTPTSTNFPAFCRQQAQAIPHISGAGLGGMCDCYWFSNDPYDPYNCYNNRDNCVTNAFPVGSYCYCTCNNFTQANRIVPGWVSTRHMSAVSCTGNKAYLLFPTQTVGCDLGPSAYFACPAYKCEGECWTTQNMMTFCKCTNGITFCACPSQWCCVSTGTGTPRMGYITDDKRYMFDMSLVCSNQTSAQCIFNTYHFWVQEINDSFCPLNYALGCVASWGYCQNVCIYMCSGGTCGCWGVWMCALPRFFPGAQNCDGWILGYTPANFVCSISASNAIQTRCLMCSLPRFFAVKLTGTGSAVCTTCTCMEEVLISCATPILMNTGAVCNQFCLNTSYSTRMAHLNSFGLAGEAFAKDAVGVSCINNPGGSSCCLRVPSSQLMDIYQIGPNLMRAHFITQYCGCCAPGSQSLPLTQPIICCNGVSCTVDLYGCQAVDLCIDNTTCCVYIVSCAQNWRCMPYWNPGGTGDLSTRTCANNPICCFDIFNPESYNNYLFAAATWGYECSGRRGTTGGYSGGGQFLFNDCVCCPSRTINAMPVHEDDSVYGHIREPYGFWRYHGIQHASLTSTCIRTEFIQNPGPCVNAQITSGICTSYGCMPVQAHSCGCLSYRPYLGVYHNICCCASPCALQTMSKCISTNCSTNFGIASSCTYQAGYVASCFAVSPKCLYASGCWGACTWAGICANDRSTLTTLRIAAINQNNSSCFIGFANATGAAGSCIPVATMGHGLACCVLLSPGCYVLTCYCYCCPSCFDSVLVSCYGVINACIGVAGVWGRSGSTCCPIADTKFCVYATTDRGCIGFFSR